MIYIRTESDQRMDREQKFISVVAYVHNAESEIEYFLDHVMEEFRRLFVRTELILVNDGSTDGSLDRIHTYFDTHDEDYIVSIIRMGRYQGMESSMNAGRDLAIGDYVYEFDDLHVDYDLSMIEQVYRSCLQGHDIVAASGNARMKTTSRLFYRIYNQASRSQNNLGQETFRILSRRAINRVKSIGAYIPYRKAVYNNCGLAVNTVSYQSSDAKGSLTRHSVNNDRTDLALDSFIYFTSVMEKVSLGICILFFVFTIAVLIYVIASYFMDNHLQSGWVSMMGFLSLGFMGVFGLLTIILKYLSVIVDLIFRHQRYLIEDIEKIAKT